LEETSAIADLAGWRGMVEGRGLMGDEVKLELK